MKIAKDINEDVDVFGDVDDERALRFEYKRGFSCGEVEMTAHFMRIDPLLTKPRATNQTS